MLSDANIFDRNGKIKVRYLKAHYPEFYEETKRELEGHPYCSTVGELLNCKLKGIEPPKCPVCGRWLSYKQFLDGKTYCSNACRRSPEAVKKETAKRRDTNMKRYGVPNAACLPETQEKTRRTCLEKYGAESYSKTEDYKRKLKSTMLERYGVEHVSQYPEFREKARQTLASRTEPIERRRPQQERRATEVFQELETNNITPLFEEWLGSINPTTGKYQRYQLRCNECETVWEDYFMTGRHFPKCPHCHPKDWQTSRQEQEAARFIMTLTHSVLLNTRTVIPPYELDIYYPDKRIAVEINGVWWHSDCFLPDTYHREKLERCTSAGVKLVQVFEDEWKYHRRAVCAYLLDLFGRNKIRINRKDVSLIPNDHDSLKFFRKYSLMDETNFERHTMVRYKGRPLALFSYGINGCTFSHLPNVDCLGIFQEHIGMNALILQDDRFPHPYDTGWTVHKILPPSFKFVLRDTRTTTEGEHKVWDCGMTVLAYEEPRSGSVSESVLLHQ